jgi:hypothetical protein
MKLEIYILEHTRALFTRRSDEPCLGAAHFEPAISGAAPLQPATTPATAFSPIRWGADPTASPTAGVGPWLPPATRDTWTSGDPPPQISSDYKCRGEALSSTTGSMLGVDAESDDHPRDQRLCRESESGWSEPS